jgi:hypothetical protein
MRWMLFAPNGSSVVLVSIIRIFSFSKMISIAVPSAPFYKPHFGFIFVFDISTIVPQHNIVFFVSYVLFRCIGIDLLLFDDVLVLHLITVNGLSSVTVLRNIYSLYAFLC